MNCPKCQSANKIKNGIVRVIIPILLQSARGNILKKKSGKKPFSTFTMNNNRFYLTLSASSEPALNLTTFLAGI
jgi:hypothetical protein